MKISVLSVAVFGIIALGTLCNAFPSFPRSEYRDIKEEFMKISKKEEDDDGDKKRYAVLKDITRDTKEEDDEYVDPNRRICLEIVKTSDATECRRWAIIDDEQSGDDNKQSEDDDEQSEDDD